MTIKFYLVTIALVAWEQRTLIFSTRMRVAGCAASTRLSAHPRPAEACIADELAGMNCCKHLVEMLGAWDLLSREIAPFNVMTCTGG